MRMKSKVSFLIALCIHFAISLADQEVYRTVENGLRSLSNVVVKYQSEFDMKVKFAPLQEAIDAIDRAMLGYQGTAKNKLSELRTINKAARLAYQNCVGPVFEWCVSINRTLDLFIPYLTDERLTNEDRDLIWHMNIDSLTDGRTKVSASLELLKSVQNKTADLRNLLDAIVHELHDDFAANGFYGKQIIEIEDSLRQKKALAIAALISAIFGVIAVISMGPIGLALGFPGAFVTIGLGVVIEQKRKATLREELEGIKTFFKVLDEKIKNASAIADQVNKDLEEDKNNLYALSGLIAAANRNGKGLLKSNPILRRNLVPSFQDLGKSCYEYTIWHGYGSTGYHHNKTRAKRDLTKRCKAERWKALKNRMRSFPLNSTFASLVSQAHFILNDIDCEPSNLSTPSKDEIAKEPWPKPSQSKPHKRIIATYLKYV